MLSVTIQPIGKRVEVEPEATLLEAARQAGVELVSICGGIGICDSCRVRLVSGQASHPTLEEQALFSAAELSAGHRLACQVRLKTEAVIEVPRESLTTLQRLQIEGQATDVPLQPALSWLDVNVTPASLEDLRADTTRLREAALLGGWPDAYHLRFAPVMLATLSDRLRSQGWSGRLVRRGDEAIAFLPSHSRVLGLAVDIGTTKLAAYLVDLESGETLGSAGEMNPQIAYGEDVLSRIAYSNRYPDGREELQARLVITLQKMAAGLADTAGFSTEQILDAVVVGNTAMHHLAAGLPVRQLGEAPYVAAAGEALQIPAVAIGMEIGSGAALYLPPNLAGFIGADHVSMLLASEAVERTERKETTFPVVLLDIGTNTEISLVLPGCDNQVRILSCSAASGPAFEGAHIQAGMRAAPGAVERVQIDAAGLRYQTVGDLPPVGICGSGILDIVAGMLENGILDRTGRIRPGHPQVRFDPASSRRGELLVAPASATGHGRDLIVLREDVHEIQLAKAAIRAGIEVLMQEAGISTADLAQAESVSFVVAGAFGTYIYLPSAIRIGMFPDLPVERFAQIGNAAGMGARQMLLSTERRQAAERIAGQIEYIELANHAGFNRHFTQALFFNHS